MGGRQPGSTNKTTLEGRQIALNFADEAMQTAVDIMRDASAPPTTRLAAAIDIMNRAWGKPTQAVSVDAESAQPLQIMIRHFSDEASNCVATTEIDDQFNSVVTTELVIVRESRHSTPQRCHVIGGFRYPPIG